MKFFDEISMMELFCILRLSIRRERATGAYGVLSYFTAKLLVELPFNLFPSFVYCVIVYWLSGLNPIPGRFLLFFLIVMLVTLTGIILGLAISAFAPSVEAASAIGPPFIIIGVLFGGFYMYDLFSICITLHLFSFPIFKYVYQLLLLLFSNIQTLPVVAEWIPNISFIRWGFQALCINEFQGETFSCDGAPESACISSGIQCNVMSCDSNSYDERVYIYLYLCVRNLVIVFVFVCPYSYSFPRRYESISEIIV